MSRNNDFNYVLRHQSMTTQVCRAGVRCSSCSSWRGQGSKPVPSVEPQLLLPLPAAITQSGEHPGLAEPQNCIGIPTHTHI